MNQTQIIYDETGYILSIRQGEPAPRNPIGVPFLNVEIPSGKQIKITEGIGVDVSSIPHQLILEDIPPSEVDELRKDLDAAILELSMMIAMGGQ